MIKNKNVKIMGIISCVLLLIIVITASFAYFGSFNVNLNNNVAVNVNSVSPGNGTFVSNATQLNLQVPAANMSLTASSNAVAASSNTAALTVSLTSGSSDIITTCTFDIYYEYTGSNYYGVSPSAKTSGADKEITMTINAPSGTSNFSTETNFDYNTSNGWTTENSKRKVKLVENATISNSGATATVQEYTFTGKYYNLDVSQEQLANKSFTGIIYANKKECIVSEISTFKIDNVQFSFEDGMTFNDWIESKYNTYNLSFDTGISFCAGLHCNDWENWEIAKNQQYNLFPTLGLSHIIDANGNDISGGFSVLPLDSEYPKEFFSKDFLNNNPLVGICGVKCENDTILQEYRPYIIEIEGVDSLVAPYTVTVDGVGVRPSDSTKNVRVLQYTNYDGSITFLDSVIGDGTVTFTTLSLSEPLMFVVVETS